MKKIDNLQVWRIFLAVAKLGSVSQAARLLDMDSPTVSHLLNDLEDDLGYRLLDRSTRPFGLTNKGRDVANAVAPLSAGFETMIENFSESTRHIINVASPIDLNQLYFHDQLFEYSEQHPDVQFYLRASCPLEDILSGRIDIALIDRPLPSADLVIRYCVQSRAVPLASRRYLEKFGYPQSVEDLKNHTGLLLRQGMHQKTSFLYSQQGHISPVLKWKMSFMTDTQLTLNHMMLDGLGIVVDCVPQHLIKELESGEVVPVLPGWSRKPQELCIVTRRDREAMSDPLHEFALWWRCIEKAAGAARVEEAEQVLRTILPEHYSPPDEPDRFS